MEPGQQWLRLWRHTADALTKDDMLRNAPFMSKLQYNLNQSTKLCIKENAFRNAVCGVAAILSMSYILTHFPLDIYTRNLIAI